MYIVQSLILLSWLIYNIVKAHNLRDQCESNLVVPDQYRQLEFTTYVLKESNTKLSSRRDIIKKDRMLAAYNHELIFRIQQNSEGRIKEILEDVSDPNSANYGQHLSPEEVAAITDNSVSREFVLTYLAAAGATVIAQTLYGEYLTARASISVWEELLDTEFYEFHYRESDLAVAKKVVRAESYSVPLSLDKHIASIFNTIQMPTKIYAKPIITRIPDEILNSTSSIQTKAAAGFINPAILKERYAIGNTLGSEQSTQAAYETIGQYFSPADLKKFQNSFMLEEEPIAFDIGGHSSDSVCVTSPSSCVEANLDIQYLMAISTRSPTTHWYTNSNSFAAFLVAVANIERPPLVISISYGADEGDMSRSEFDAFNFQAMKLGVMGVTILAASGDDGASSFMARGNTRKCGYMPLFPASSPYVTAVGGTQGVESGTKEIACQSNLGGAITSGGGFSNYFPRPAWQSDAVSNYFSKIAGTSDAPVVGYNRDGRGYPDVSAAAAHYLVFIGGIQYSISGTSASTPVMAGIFSLVNAARLEAGKSSLGWINPVLYRGHQYYTNDVVSGKNNCPASSLSSSECCRQGFSAKVGWDPVTGLGSINFMPFMDLMINLEDISTPVIVTSPPTQQLTRAPTTTPSFQRTDAPTLIPTPMLTNLPTRLPTPQPTPLPTFEPSLQPSLPPSSKPTTGLGATFGSGRAPRIPIGFTSSLPTSSPTTETNTRSKKKSGGKGKTTLKKNTKGKGKGKT